MIRAVREDKALVVSILVTAFAPNNEDNSINFVVKQDGKRLARMHVLMGYLFEKAMSSGEVFLSDNRACCLLINYPHKERMTARMLKSTIGLAFQCIGIERIFKVLRRQKLVKGNHPTEHHIRPLIFGVKSEYKGGVTAPRLIMQVFDDFSDNKLPVIIDTVSDYNLKLYQKFGFRVYGKEESLGFPMYFLRLN